MALMKLIVNSNIEDNGPKKILFIENLRIIYKAQLKWNINKC